jgi:hypothetical protein
MSDRPQGEGWWLASDGKWYPPESQPAAAAQAPVPPQAPYPAPARRPGPGLTMTIRVFFIVAAVLALLGALAYVNEISKFNTLMDSGSVADEDSWTTASGVAGVVTAFFYLAALVTAILLMVWGNQAHRGLAPLQPSGISWSPGWAVGGWFIPLANAIIPRLVFNEIEKVLDPENGPPPVGDRWHARRLLGSGLAWWILYMAGFVILAVGLATTGSGMETSLEVTLVTDETLYRNGLVVMVPGLTIIATACFFAAVYFKKMGERISR